MKIIIPEIRIPNRRLGRNINHDPRSLRFLAPPTVEDRTVSWKRNVPVFDQGNIGSCTGNAEAGLLGTDPFTHTLPDNLSIDEALAVKIYSAATRIDPYTGQYPPNDTGSDGLSVNKAAKDMGFISGYVWAISVDQAKTLIQKGPFITGTDWTSNMDKPDPNGIIANPAGGSVRGGHEYECFARDAEKDLWWFYNSWGADWGWEGKFAYNSAGLAALLKRGADITQSVPLSEPPPTPVPTDDPDLAVWWTNTKPWTLWHHSGHGSASIASEACKTLALKKGL